MYDDLGLCPDEVARLRSNLLAGTPMGRFAAPEEIAPWVCTLLDGELSGWVTGALIAVDGGRTA
jgi:NAD(P)-dependent dehydrogenase (short-subunit alcohol dehydrogenase family)